MAASGRGMPTGGISRLRSLGASFSCDAVSEIEMSKCPGAVPQLPGTSATAIQTRRGRAMGGRGRRGRVLRRGMWRREFCAESVTAENETRAREGNAD